MKKIILRLALGAAFLFLPFFIVEWNIQIRASKEPSQKTKNLLYYLYGSRNLTPSEKKQMISEEKFFPDERKKKLDDKMTNDVFPDKDTLYSIDTNFVISFHKQNGNPEVFFGCFQGDCDHNRYSIADHAIIITAFARGDTANSLTQNGYFDELAHAKQWTDAPKTATFRYWFESASTWIIQKMLDCLCAIFDAKYSLGYESGIETEAHGSIGPDLKEDYLAYRKEYFRDCLTGTDAKADSCIIYTHVPSFKTSKSKKVLEPDTWAKK